MSAFPFESAESALATLPPRQSLRQAGLTLAWREAGSGPAVVFLHGLLGSADSWVLQFADLAASHRVVAWDAPGYGGSSPLGPDIAAYADALAVLLARLGLEGATVVGHSMGGVVAALAAARPESPIGRVVLSCSHPGYAAPPDTPPTAKLLGRLEALRSEGPEAYGRARAQAMVAPGASAEAVALAARIAAETRPDGLYNATRALQFADARPCYAQIRAPMLVLFGGADPVVRPELSAELRALTPRATHRVLPGVGHAPYLEDPATYDAALRDFVSRP